MYPFKVRLHPNPTKWLRKDVLFYMIEVLQELAHYKPALLSCKNKNKIQTVVTLKKYNELKRRKRFKDHYKILPEWQV